MKNRRVANLQWGTNSHCRTGVPSKPLDCAGCAGIQIRSRTHSTAYPSTNRV